MQVLQIDDVEHLPRPSVATIGKYDGLHRGQQAVLERLKEKSVALGCASVVLTFRPHPVTLLKPNAAPRLLTTFDQKIELIADCEVDYVVVVPFTSEFAETSAQEFVRDHLGRRLEIQGLLVGDQFRFGKARQGDLTLLRTLGKELGFEVEGLQKVHWKGQSISSSRIRRSLGDGDLEGANAMLGRPYAIRGKVVQGKGLGKELGWPTLNLEHFNELLPPDGVYVTRARILGGDRAIDSISNVGRRPTLHTDSERVLECHLLERSVEAYGEEVEVELLKYLRPEKRFADKDALVRQISLDVARAREYLAQL